MQVRTRSNRIRKALAIVKARVPPKDWATITSFLSYITTDRGWQTVGLSPAIDPQSAALLPIYDLSAANVSKPTGAQIRFTLPLRQRYSISALVGLVAHELAHALRAGRLGVNWLTQMGGEWTEANEHTYRFEERRADAIASAWGFRKQIRTMRNERAAVLNPYLAKHESDILHRAMKRYERQEKEARRRFGVSCKN